MPAYSFRCPECGAFDLTLPMGGAGPDAPCPACGRPARRVYTAPRLRSLRTAVAAAHAAAERSAERPTVVHRPPRTASSPSPVRATPAHPPLPRP